ncbi:MAG: AbrB/MazE/SpoVT family DNA-binding domain-containing protein [Deltaproteobacteria bacterium]|nr:AbrB/MazE/SpoVT family DNA-binding domain-containing protein [Deltaproteobacteria bacterium]
MAPLATTKMSSKGQIVIPEDIRRRLGLKTWAQFIIIDKNDVVILKSIAQPSMTEFDQLISDARKQARKVGMKKSDITSAIQRVRKQK